MKIYHYIIPLLLPILFVVFINEYSRYKLSNGYYNKQYDLKAMNSNIPNPEKCTWTGHFNTNYCKNHHVKLLKPYFKFIDPIYFGIINFLQSTGNYMAGNILFLVILWPAIMYFLLLKIIHLRIKLRNGINH